MIKFHCRLVVVSLKFSSLISNVHESMTLGCCLFSAGYLVVLNGCHLFSPAVVSMLHIVNQSYDRIDSSSPDEVLITTSLAKRDDYNDKMVLCSFTIQSEWFCDKIFSGADYPHRTRPWSYVHLICMFTWPSPACGLTPACVTVRRIQ